MNIDLSGKRALVCGATRGIGNACAIELASLGAECVLLARDAAMLEKTANELSTAKGQRHSFVRADFDDPATVQAGTLEAVSSGTIHILINNTGGPPGGKAIDAKIEEFINAFRQHIVSGQLLVQTLVPGMKQANYGRIINIISTSVKAPIPGLGVSNTIRGATANWSKTLASELAPFGITVNNLLPGYTDTDRLRTLIAARAKASNVPESQVEKEMMESVPARRFARPDELAAVAAFLASPAAGYVNGINVPVDGGRTPSL